MYLSNIQKVWSFWLSVVIGYLKETLKREALYTLIGYLASLKVNAAKWGHADRIIMAPRAVVFSKTVSVCLLDGKYSKHKYESSILNLCNDRKPPSFTFKIVIIKFNIKCNINYNNIYLITISVVTQLLLYLMVYIIF